MPDITFTTVLIVLFWSICVGFGIAIGQWLWSVLTAAFSRGS